MPRLLAIVVLMFVTPAAADSLDLDLDGDDFSIREGDCDDTRLEVHPDAEEVCDGLDNDCDGDVTGEQDDDRDGWRACGGDCDDTSAEVHPGAAEHCDGVDNDCVNGVPLTEADQDGDNVRVCEGDCDDRPGAGFDVQPGRPEIADNGTDDDCDGVIDNVPGPGVDDGDEVPGTGGCTDRGCGWSIVPEPAGEPAGALLICGALGALVRRRRHDLGP